MGIHQNLTGAQRTVRFRARKRAQGLRLAQIWLPDLRDPKAQEELRRSAAEINRRDRRDGVMDYVESLTYDLLSSLPEYDWGPDGPPQDDAKA